MNMASNRALFLSVKESDLAPEAQSDGPAEAIHQERLLLEDYLHRVYAPERALIPRISEEHDPEAPPSLSCEVADSLSDDSFLARVVSLFASSAKLKAVIKLILKFAPGVKQKLKRFAKSARSVSEHYDYEVLAKGHGMNLSLSEERIFNDLIRTRKERS